MKGKNKIYSQGYLMPFLILFALGVLIFLYLPTISPSVASTGASYSINLTGIWNGDDDGTYYISHCIVDPQGENDKKGYIVRK